MGQEVKCDRCIEVGAKCRIFEGVTMVTVAFSPPFYDEEGKLHGHDANVRTVRYECSNGHRWETQSAGDWWCGWKGLKPGDVNQCPLR